ncbi:hypothetical protein K523DRAFT_297178 [Schizophyllum commune Tattone D]|nr:hypothetical protein K523DRAFT_297178 [Schizophyllum commune Tattone D]
MAAAAANAGREEYQHARQRNFGGNPGNSVNIEEVVGGMEASGIQRTPLVARTANAFAGRTQSAWMNQQPQAQPQQRHKPHRQSFVAQHDSGNINGSHPGNVSYSGNVSDRSESMHDADSVREMLMPGQQQQPRHSMTQQGQQGLSTNQAGSWGRAMSSATRPRLQSNAFPASASRPAGVFRPSRVPR